MVPTNPLAQRRSSAWAAVCVSIVAAIVPVLLFWHSAVPYRLIPTDEQEYLDPFRSPALAGKPMFAVWMQICVLLWRSFDGTPPPSAILLNVAIASAMGAALVGFMVWRLSNSTLAAASGALMYATCPWLGTYWAWGSYAPFGAMLAAIAVWLLLEGFFIHQAGDEHEELMLLPLLVLMAGGAAGLFLMSASGAPVLILLIGVMIPVLFWKASARRKFVLTGAFFLPMTSMLPWLAPTLLHAQRGLLAHNEHFAEAQTKHGWVPQIPTFVGFRIAALQAPLALCGLVLITCALGYLCARKWATEREKVVLAIAGLVLGHALFIDRTGGAPLGRVHFSPIPLLYVALAAGASCLAERFSAFGSAIIRRTALATAVAVVVTFQASAFRQRLVTKQAGAVALAELSRTTRLFMLGGDPHSKYIGAWASDARITTVADLHEVINMSGPRAVIFGPHGPSSGRSILEHSVLEDLMLSEPPPGAQVRTVPYFAYYPPFVVEEELMLALYFGRGVPDHAQRDWLTVWTLGDGT